ncbi:hypothetical protein [Enterococcus durans]|uniref:Bacteriocin n=1 Tax=Enterococcus durans TaxID=53345 RepID=A0A377KIH2_9ENTE|nr:hypothetical protein [Enterococcus durans]STP28856.1 Uncharacterised protein [Enterococcus durans]
MNQLEFLENQYKAVTLEDMYDINGGIIISLAGVTLVLTAKAIAGGIALISAIVGGAYGIGYVLGKGWAYVK